MVKVPVPPPNGKPVFLACMPFSFVAVHGNRASFIQPRRKHILKPISLEWLRFRDSNASGVARWQPKAEGVSVQVQDVPAAPSKRIEEGSDSFKALTYIPRIPNYSKFKLDKNILIKAFLLFIKMPNHINIQWSETLSVQ